jgi:hypothetical protein
MSFDLVGGLTIVKLIGVLLGAVCIWTRRLRVIQWVNYIFAGIVVWNLYNLLGAVPQVVVASAR